MKIRSLTLSNFRSFGARPTTIDLSNLTAIIGSNASGKTTVLRALVRLYGISPGDRALRQDDFHVPPGQSPDELDRIDLFIEARLEFPELTGDKPAGQAVPQCFRQMVVEREGALPYCRVRLEGRWTRTSLPGGDVEEAIYWLATAAQEVQEEERQRMQGYERSRIQVLYVPAMRDPARQLRQVSGTLFSRLLRAVTWSDEARRRIGEAAESVSEAFQHEAGVELIQGTLNRNWDRLHDLAALSNIRLRPFGRQLEEILKQVEVVFGPGEAGGEHSVDRLSDGLRSLFYLALIASTFDVEQAVLAAAGAGQH